MYVHENCIYRYQQETYVDTWLPRKSLNTTVLHHGNQKGNNWQNKDTMNWVWI